MLAIGSHLKRFDERCDVFINIWCIYPINIAQNAGTLPYQCFRESRCIFFLFTDISNDENMLLRIFFDNEIPQKEKNIFVRRYLYDCIRLSQSNS